MKNKESIQEESVSCGGEGKLRFPNFLCYLGFQDNKTEILI